jgi:hypothetical protein
MSHYLTRRLTAPVRAAVLLLSASLVGCAMTETTTSIRSLPGPALERIRLERPGPKPISATWRQDGLALVGELAFTDACRTETVQVTRRTQLTDTHPNRSYSTGAYVAGAALSLLGVVLVANAQGKDTNVTCGSGGGAPRSGDTCESDAGAWREIGAVTIGAGLGAILGGVIVQSGKPVVKAQALPSEQQVRVSPGKHSCGSVAALKGSTVAAALTSGGEWTGVVDAQGAVRIDLSGSAHLRGTHAALRLESVAPAAATLLVVGTPLGELDLEPAHAEPLAGLRASSSRARTRQ